MLQAGRTHREHLYVSMGADLKRIVWRLKAHADQTGTDLNALFCRAFADGEVAAIAGGNPPPSGNSATDEPLS